MIGDNNYVYWFHCGNYIFDDYKVVVDESNYYLVDPDIHGYYLDDTFEIGPSLPPLAGPREPTPVQTGPSFISEMDEIPF